MQPVNTALRFHQVDPADLSPRLKELVDVIGLQAAAKLIAKRGGTRVTVPASAEGSVLADIIGIEALERMITHYGIGEITLDRGAAALKAVEDREILRELSAGVSAPALAIRYGRTERAIYKLAARAGKLDTSQLDLYR